MSRHSYEDRVLRVLNYIYENPGADLSLDALADVAAMSRFHWHRVFQAMTGESCAMAVRRVRMHRAAFWLVQSDYTVSKIATMVGYTNTQSFARSFREVFDCTPRAVRSLQTSDPVTFQPRTGDPDMYDVKITKAPKRRLAAHHHIGPYNEIAKSFEQASAVFTARNLWPQARGMAGIYFDDPGTVPAEKLRSCAGVEVGEDFTIPDPLEEVVIEGGEAAVLTLKGPYTELQAAYDWFYGQWLPQSGRMPADQPSYEIYLNSMMDTAPADLLTEIYMPLQPQTTG